MGRNKYSHLEFSGSRQKVTADPVVKSQSPYHSSSPRRISPALSYQGKAERYIFVYPVGYISVKYNDYFMKLCLFGMVAEVCLRNKHVSRDLKDAEEMPWTRVGSSLREATI